MKIKFNINKYNNKKNFNRQNNKKIFQIKILMKLNRQFKNQTHYFVNKEKTIKNIKIFKKKKIIFKIK